ncbi:MAG: hydrogenase formation protein HypD [Desulfobacteraceae bacterium]|jgi:hydrogenase expression/formation protein HypD
MTITYAEEYRDPAIAKSLVHQLASLSQKPVRLMEVCGTHTMAIFRHGIRALLPRTITLLSGPGCPVCVTAQGDIDAFVALSRRPDVTLTTFGDLMRVPGSGSSLQRETAEGADVRVVYSAMDAVQLAGKRPDREVIFLGVGFETTAPTIAAAIISARQMNLKNFSIYCAHKTVPVALKALMDNPSVQIDGFLLPGHVSVIIGLNAYRPFFEQYQTPGVVAGFEPVDVLRGVLELVTMLEKGRPGLGNVYPRAVTAEGNTQAQHVLAKVFEPCDTCWRGLGVIPGSGLSIRSEYADFDAVRRFDFEVGETPEPKGCACGEILSGTKTPPECALFRKACTPMNPVGPCMVSSEGTCAAYYRYAV